MKTIHSIVAILLVLIIVSFTNINAQPPLYNDVEERVIVISIHNSSYDYVYVNSYVYHLSTSKDLGNIPDYVYINLLKRMNNSISALTDSYFYKAFANDTRNLLKDIGIDVYDIHVGLDLVVIYAFNGSMINRLDDNIVNMIFDLYMNCKTLRREIAVTMAIGKGYNLNKARYIADQIMNMSIDEVHDRFKVIVIHMPVTKEEYERYYNETLNRFLELSEQGVMPKWITSIGESMFGTIVIIIRLDILEKNGLTIKDAVEYLRNISGNNYPLQIVVFPTEQFEVLLDRSDRAIYPIEHLYIILGAITITAISLALYKRNNLIK